MTRSRRFLSVLALALTGVGCVVGGTSVWRWIQSVRHERVAASREPAALSAWRQRFGDPEAVVAQFTRASDNTTAERLVALARPLGIALENGSENAVPDFPEANAIGRYVNTAGAMTDPSVRIYLDAHRSDVASIVDLLITADRPIWKSTVSSALPLPEPSLNILGARRLNNVLAAAALREASEGRARDADRAAEAAWEVARSARNRPRMVGQLISINLAVADLGIDRRTAVDAGWRSRLDEYDFAGSLEHSIETDAVERILGDDGSMRARAFLADYLDGMRANLERLRTIRLPDPSPQMSNVESGGNEQSVAPGLMTAEIAWPGLESAYRSVLCDELDVELTKRVVEARQANADTGRWPTAMPDLTSALVPGAHWVYRAAGRTISVLLNPSVPSCPSSAQSFETQW